MQYDISVLRAILRLSRHRREVDHASLELRVAGDPSELRNALRRLESQGLVARLPVCIRLTLPGLAVAIASLPKRAKRTRQRIAATRAA